MIIRFLNKISQKYASKWLIMIFDLAIVAVTFFMAHFIRFNLRLEFDPYEVLNQIPFVVAAAFLSFLAVGSHKGVVRFTGFKDVVNIIIGVNILATVLLITTFYNRKYNLESYLNLSGSIIYIHLLLNILFLIGFKLFVKSIYHKLMQDFNTIKNVLIFGAGNSGTITYETITNDPKNGLHVIGFIDDNEQKIGKKINLLNVYSLQKITSEF